MFVATESMSLVAQQSIMRLSPERASGGEWRAVFLLEGALASGLTSGRDSLPFW
jgi:hypothetical protein